MDFSDTIRLLAATVLPSFLLTFVFGFSVRKYAAAWNLMDRPEARKNHRQPVALGGGLAIWASVLCTFAAGQFALFLVSTSPAISVPAEVQLHLPGLLETTPKLWLCLGTATIAMVLGLADDWRGLPWQFRIFVQTSLAAFIVFGQGWKLTFYVGIPVLSSLVSILWIVGLINSFNMLDNMDGLSAGVAAIVAGALAAVMVMAPDPQTRQPQLFVAGFFLVLLGALLGFLVHNRHPAQLFMGDAGSYFIGFCLAVGTMIATFAGYAAGTRHAVLTPLVALAVPLYDTGTVVWIRLRSGNSPFVADRNHFSHRLVDLGLTPSQAVRTIYLLTTACALGAMLLHRVDTLGAAIVVAMILCVLSVIAVLESSARRKLML